MTPEPAGDSCHGIGVNWFHLGRQELGKRFLGKVSERPRTVEIRTGRDNGDLRNNGG